MRDSDIAAELPVRQVAERLGAIPGTVYYWLAPARSPHPGSATCAVCIPFTPDIGTALRAKSTIARLTARAQNTPTGGAV